MDMQKVLEAGPWAFEQNMLVYNKVSDMKDPHTVKLEEVDIWVQVYDIPTGFLSENILKSVGSYIGKFIKSNPSNFDGLWKSFVRIRVKISILKPIKRRMKIKREGGTWSWVNFKYERLAPFCFVCGLLGHIERDCNVVYAHPDKEIERAYGVWLRVLNRNIKQNIGARWLRNMNGEEKWVGYGGWTSAQEGNSNQERNKARFHEVDRTMYDMKGDNGMITVTSRNQGDMTEKINISNLSVLEGGIKNGENIVIDPKRRRVEKDGGIKDNGPVNMQTDGHVGNIT